MPNYRGQRLISYYKVLWSIRTFDITTSLNISIYIFSSIFLRRRIQTINDSLYLLYILDVHEIGLFLFIVVIIYTCNTIHIICTCKPLFAQYENNIKIKSQIFCLEKSNYLVYFQRFSIKC